MENQIKQKKKFEIDMCNGNLFTKIIIFSIPLMLMGMLQLFYNAADLIIVGKFSNDPDALGAVGSTSSLINLVVTLFMGLSVGTNVSCAKLLGAKEYDSVLSATNSFISVKEEILPDAETVKLYNDKYNKFKMIYPSLKNLYENY